MSLLPLPIPALIYYILCPHLDLVKNIKLKTKRLITEVTLCNENCLNVRLKALRAGTAWDVGSFAYVTLPRDSQTGSPQDSHSPLRCFIWLVWCFSNIWGFGQHLKARSYCLKFWIFSFSWVSGIKGDIILHSHMAALGATSWHGLERAGDVYPDSQGLALFQGDQLGLVCLGLYWF